MKETIEKFDEEACEWARAGLIQRLIKTQDEVLKQSVAEARESDDGSTNTAAGSSGSENGVSKKRGTKRDSTGKAKEVAVTDRDNSPCSSDIEETDLQEQNAQDRADQSSEAKSTKSSPLSDRPAKKVARNRSSNQEIDGDVSSASDTNLREQYSRSKAGEEVEMEENVEVASIEACIPPTTPVREVASSPPESQETDSDISNANETSPQESSTPNEVEEAAEIEEGREVESTAAYNAPTPPKNDEASNLPASQDMESDVANVVVETPSPSNETRTAKELKAVEQLKVAQDLIRKFFSNLDPAVVERAALPATLKALCTKSPAIQNSVELEMTPPSSDAQNREGQNDGESKGYEGYREEDGSDLPP